MSMIEAGLISLILGFIAGYIFHGYEFDKKLADLERRFDVQSQDMGDE